MREQWGAVWVDWPEPLFLFNVFKSFCAVASQREQPFHLLHRHVSNSMKNDSYTGCEVAPASSVPYILRRSSTACRTVFCFWCVSTFTVKQWWSYLSNTFFFLHLWLQTHYVIFCACPEACSGSLFNVTESLFVFCLKPGCDFNHFSRTKWYRFLGLSKVWGFDAFVNILYLTHCFKWQCYKRAGKMTWLLIFSIIEIVTIFNLVVSGGFFFSDFLYVSLALFLLLHINLDYVLKLWSN